MASKICVFAVVSILLLLPCAVLGTEYVVGDDNGWTTNVDYTAWAKGKTFYVGDVLVFRYDPNYHNVYKVGANDFMKCNATGTPLYSGNDIVRLLTPGKKWYICGFPDHCALYHQKLVLDIMPMAPAPAPAW